MLLCVANRRAAVWATAVLLWVSACKKESQQQVEPAQGATAVPNAAVAAAEPSARWYRATIDREGDEIDPIPFFIQVPRAGASEALVIRNGKLDMKPEFEWKGDALQVRFPIFHTRIEARAEGDDLTGAFRSESRSWGEAELGFRASPIDAPHAARQFAGEATEPGNAIGTWRLEFPETGDAKLSLRAVDGAGIEGVLTFSSANSVHLAGARYGDALKLSSFDGTSPYLLTATITGTDIEGAWAAGQGLSWSEEFEGARAEDEVELESGLQVAKGAKRLTVPGVDLSEYEGKPTIVELAGSWCITCKHMAPFLAEIYAEHNPKGLQMVTLTYEFTDDEAYNAKQAERFKKEYEIPWKVIPVHGDVDSIPEMMPPSLENLDITGFPISIFVAPDGSIRYLHAGFPNEAATEERAHVITEYRQHVEALLAGK